MKCANCSDEAIYVYDVAATQTLFFCDKHLPKFLRASARAGTLPRTEAYAKIQQEVLEILATEPEVEEPVVEEPVEEVVEDEPKPRAKRTRKAAEPVEDEPEV